MSVQKIKLQRVLLTIIIFYGLLLFCGCAWQRKLLYFPTRFSTTVAEQTAVREGFSPWRNQIGEIVGWKLAASSPTGSVLIVHGNAGCALNRDYIARPIYEAGSLDVFILEYPGYGARSGPPSMKTILSASEEAFEMLPDNLPVFVVSESIGAGPGSYLALNHPTRIAGMVMFVPYHNLALVAQSKMPVLLPYLFLVDRYKPGEWLKDYRGPVKIVLAESDKVIPPKFGQRLFDSYAGPKMLEIVPGAGHNDVAEQAPEWWREVFKFWHSSTVTNNNRL